MMKTPLLALLAFSSFAIGIVDCADAQPERWTIVGSAGTVDEADLGQVDLTGSAVGMKPEVLSGNAVIRYHVDLPGGPLRVGTGAVLEAVYLDPGPTSHVNMRLYGVVFDKDTGVKDPDLKLVELDSNAHPAAETSSKPQALTGNSCKSWEDVKGLYNEDPKDIFFRAFYIEVALSKQPGGNPKVHTLTVSRLGCPLP
jgi:hypothetical protein